MEISVSQPLLLASLLLPFTWLLAHLLSAASPHEPTNSHGWRIPSPSALPVFGHLHLLKKLLHRCLAMLATLYGGVGAGLLHLWFGSKPVLLVTSPAVAGECFTAHDVALANRPGLVSRRLLTQNCPAIAMCDYGPLWSQLRRLATMHALCAHGLAAAAAARDAGARAMAARLRRAGPGEVAVRATAYQFVANVIMAMVAGQRMPEEQVLRFKAMTEAGWRLRGRRTGTTRCRCSGCFDFGRTRRRLAGLAKARRDFGQSILDHYRRRHPRGGADDAKETARTVLGDLLRQQQEERSPEPLDDVVIRSVCLMSQHGRMHGRHQREMQHMCAHEYRTG
ncbi:hypothetical protein SETIT_3G368500v2 [Setaria italica]|uniref:Cytochrome P450 n=1 Tax=Setaria italica TaxID=4555 RepID=K3ZDY0_SETIT|nr:hypothetical protein SETIT_3G368500v2 [Setaria italica]